MRTRTLAIAAAAAVCANVVAVAAAPGKPAPTPAKPTVATQSVQNLTSTGVTLRGTVNPRGLATTFQFQYGKTTSYGASTGPVAAGSGNANVPVTANVTGLTPNTIYHYRLVATNQVGTSVTADRSVRTAVQPTTISLIAKPNPVVYGGNVILSGQLTGPTPANQQVTLEQNAYPFSGTLKAVGNAVTTDAQGNFVFPAFTLLQNTQFQAVTGRTRSAIVTVGNRVIVRMSVKSRVRKHRRVRFSATVSPPQDGALYAIQRRKNGKWVTVVGGTLTHLDPTRSHFVRRLRIHRSATWRVFTGVSEQGHISNASAARRITAVG